MKSKVLFFTLFFTLLNIFSQEEFQTEIKAGYFKLIEKTYNDMERMNIDLSKYVMSISIENNILYVRFHNPEANWTGLGSPPGFPIFNYEVDITSGEIIKKQGER
jgi:hypothetical protein